MNKTDTKNHHHEPPGQRGQKEDSKRSREKRTGIRWKGHLTSPNCHLEYNAPYLQILGEAGLLPSILYPAN